MAKTNRAWILAMALFGGCVGAVGDEEEGPVIELVAGLDVTFEEAAVEFDVPADLLKAIGYVESQWQMVAGEPEFDGQPAAFGIMGLRGDGLTRGAELAGVTEDEAKSEPAANIRAAAALLDATADELALDRANLGAWAPAVAQYSGIDVDEGQREYVVREVYGILNQGVEIEAEGGQLLASIPPTQVVADFPAPGYLQAGGTVDYAGAIWRGSPNYNSRPSGAIGDVAMVIIHTCEGGYSGCWSWLANPAAGASAHYVVSGGGEISQLVRESNRAWHIAAEYSCSRNNSVECWRNGYSSNHFTVGIEHAGYASQSSFPGAQINASAKLVCDITDDHAIPRDRQHILGHGQLQPWNRTDPGPNWPWTSYIQKIKDYCGGGGTDGGGGTPPPPSGGGEIIVDSNNANNDGAKAKIQVSGNWTAANATSGYYGTGYWWAGTSPISDGAAFLFYMPSAGSRTIDAWWTAGGNRSPSAPFVIFNAGGTKLDTVFKNQQTNGGKWVTLGTWNFTAGWNKVVLSRWTGEGYVVVADAIRVR